MALIIKTRNLKNTHVLIMQDADTSREKYESIINLRTVDKKQLPM